MKKKNITFLLFLTITSAVLMASYHTNRNENLSSMDYLTNHVWKFSHAESSNSKSQSVINALYQNSNYFFSSSQDYEGLFFDRSISGTWELEGNNKLILNKGTINEEVYEIIKITTETMQIRTIEKGTVVTLTYK